MAVGVQLLKFFSDGGCSHNRAHEEGLRLPGCSLGHMRAGVFVTVSSKVLPVGETLLPYNLPQEEKSFSAAGMLMEMLLSLSSCSRAAAALPSVSPASPGNGGVWYFLLVTCQSHSVSLC